MEESGSKKPAVGRDGGAKPGGATGAEMSPSSSSSSAETIVPVLRIGIDLGRKAGSLSAIKPMRAAIDRPLSISSKDASSSSSPGWEERISIDGEGDTTAASERRGCWCRMRTPPGLMCTGRSRVACCTCYTTRAVSALPR